MITKLQPNQIFVFGSNLAGEHIGGAAKQAKEQFGAEDGVGEGLTGQCYAFPTLNADLSQRTMDELKESREKLFSICFKEIDKDFLLTKVGCGIAGFDEKDIKKLFEFAPVNLVLPKSWIKKRVVRSSGRPRLGEDKLYRHHYHFKNKEFVKLEAKAQQYSMTTPVFVRSILLREIS